MPEEKLGNWMEGFDEESIKKSMEVGEILPKMNIPNIPEGQPSGDVVKMEILEDAPKRIEKDFLYGKEGFVIPVKSLDEGTLNMEYSLWIPNSLRYKLIVLAKQHNNSLKGLKVGIWKEIGDTKKYENATLYNVQVLKEIEGE